MVTCTAITGSDVRSILNGPRQRGPAQHRGQAQQIVSHDIDGKQRPVALLEVGKALKGIAGKSCVGAAEANGYEQPPARIGQGALAGPDEKQTQQKTASHVDE